MGLILWTLGWPQIKILFLVILCCPNISTLLWLTTQFKDFPFVDYLDLGNHPITYIYISNHHVIHFKYVQLYLSIIPSIHFFFQVNDPGKEAALHQDWHRPVDPDRHGNKWQEPGWEHFQLGHNFEWQLISAADAGRPEGVVGSKWTGEHTAVWRGSHCTTPCQLLPPGDGSPDPPFPKKLKFWFSG